MKMKFSLSFSKEFSEIAQSSIVITRSIVKDSKEHRETDTREEKQRKESWLFANLLNAYQIQVVPDRCMDQINII